MEENGEIILTDAEELDLDYIVYEVEVRDLKANNNDLESLKQFLLAAAVKFLEEYDYSEIQVDIVEKEVR